MMATRVLNSAVLHSYESLQNFFDSSDAAAQVLSWRDRPLAAEPRPLEIKTSFDPNLLPNLHGVWHLCQVITEPFRWVGNIVLKAIAYLTASLGEEKFSKQIKLAAQQMKAGFALSSRLPNLALPQLATTRNRPNDQGMVSQMQPIFRGQIPDPRVQKRIRFDAQDRATFSGEIGICRGICDWFIHLYFKTKDRFSDPRSHMAALGEQFASGGGVESTLLQSLDLRGGKLLNMRIGLPRRRALINGEWLPVIEDRSLCNYTFFDWKDAQEDLVQELSNLPAGIYQVNTSLHAMTYIKINERLSFLFDPNVGILEISGEEAADRLYFLILNTAGRLLKKAAKAGYFSHVFPELSSAEITSTQIPQIRIQFIPYQERHNCS